MHILHSKSESNKNVTFFIPKKSKKSDLIIELSTAVCKQLTEHLYHIFFKHSPYPNSCTQIDP